jgi:hypothetical protein
MNVTTTLDSLHSAADGSMSRLALAHGLRAAASMLQRLADRMTPVERRASAALTLPRLEFHGDAAAPEGALYVDGILFGHLPGVHRL